MQIRRVLLLGVLLFSMLIYLGCDQGANTDPETDPAPDSQTGIDTASQPDTDTNEEKVPHPEGWTKETHGKKGDPNYGVVFPDNEVKRWDITISASDWQEMMQNMEDIWGPRGNTPGCDSEPSPMSIQAEEAAPGFGDTGGNLPSSFRSPGENSMPDENPMYKPCTLVFEGNTWHHVGIRFKGNSTLRSSWKSGTYKLPLRLTFDEFENDFPEIDDQRFFGFKNLSLSSNWSDKSFLREKVAADIFRDAGVPAPRTAFYRIFIDYGEGSKYFGLYTLVEIPDDPMLKSQFSDKGGNLYKPMGLGAGFSTYVEEDYDKKNNKEEADYSDVRALYDAVNADRTNAAGWRANLEKALNVDGFLRWLAVNTTIQNWDTYGQMSQNYYLYNDPADSRLHWIPYDNNMALWGLIAPSLELSSREISNQWPLIRYLIDDPVYHATYVNYVEETITTTFNPQRMRPIYKAAHDLIRPYVVGAQGELAGYTLLSSKADFDKGLDSLNQHVRDRYDTAQSFIGENQP